MNHCVPAGGCSSLFFWYPFQEDPFKIKIWFSVFTSCGGREYTVGASSLPAKEMGEMQRGFLELLDHMNFGSLNLCMWSELPISSNKNWIFVFVTSLIFHYGPLHRKLTFFWDNILYLIVQILSPDLWLTSLGVSRSQSHGPFLLLLFFSRPICLSEACRASSLHKCLRRGRRVEETVSPKIKQSIGTWLGIRQIH